MILIVGYGNIGKHIHEELRSVKDVDIYDKFIPEYNCRYDKLYDLAFICVPTEMLQDGSCDTSIVEEAVGNTNARVIVIKSTVPVGTCDRLREVYGKKIVFSPEYYGTTQHADASPDFLVLGGSSEDCDVVAQLYYKVKAGNFKIYFTDYKTAELAKYMENCFLALKVTFCAEFATIAKEFDISYPQLREIFVADHRMGSSHTFVLPEQPYYNSHCLNKDVPALVTQSNKAHLMQAVLNVNAHKKLDINY